MVVMVGKYKHYKNENLDDYFIAIGAPYLARKMIAMVSPTMEINVSEDGLWTISYKSSMPTIEFSFRLGEECTEPSPTTTIKSVTVQEGDELITTSVIGSEGARAGRRYTFTDDECILTLTHEKSNKETKRFFRRIKE